MFVLVLLVVSDRVFPLVSQHTGYLLEEVRALLGHLLVLEVVDLVFDVDVVGVGEVQALVREADVEGMLRYQRCRLFLPVHGHCLGHNLFLLLCQRRLVLAILRRVAPLTAHVVV